MQMAFLDFIVNALRRKTRRARRRGSPKPPPEHPLPEIDPSLARVANTVVRPKFSGDVAGHLDQTLRQVARQISHPGDRLLISRLFRALKNEGMSLPVMPENVLRIQHMLQEPDCSVSALAHVISGEPIVAAKFISVANSPMYAATRAITTLEDAIVRLGLTQTSVLILAIVARSRLFKAAHFQREANALYAHSLACGATCQVLARRVEGVRADESFTVGLFQELGRVFVLSVGGGLVRENPAHGPQRATLTWLADELDGGFSALVAESWGYEEQTVRALELHNQVGRTPNEVVMLGPNDPDRLTYLVAASDLMAHLAVQGEEAIDIEVLERRLDAVDITLDEALRLQVSTAVNSLVGDLASGGLQAA